MSSLLVLPCADLLALASAPRTEPRAHCLLCHCVLLCEGMMIPPPHHLSPCLLLKATLALKNAS